MALITCVDCHKHISDAAKSCPHCGRPINALTIEATAKKWKIFEVIGFGLGSSGIALSLFFILRYGLNNVTSSFYLLWMGCFLFLAGIIVGIAGQVGAWWENR